MLFVHLHCINSLVPFMSSNQFILTKEHLTGWLSDPSYMEEYKAQVYRSILQFYFDTFFEEIHPAKRAIVEIEKDLGLAIEKETLLNLFYYDTWSRKRKKEKSKENSMSNKVTSSAGNTELAKEKTEVESTGQTFDFKDAKEITGGNKPLYVGKKQRAKQAEEDDKNK